MQESEPDDFPPRPNSRLECLPGGYNSERPCPWLGCRYHIATDVNPETGHFRVIDGWEERPTCALDVAAAGGITLEEAGAMLDLTRERVRQIEARALWKLKRKATSALLTPHFEKHDLVPS